MKSSFEATFLGTSGSCPYDNGNRVKYGANTSCVAVKAGGQVIIFDAGSGICGFSSLKDYQSEHLHVFFSHYHIDHTNGLLFFPPLFNASKKIDLYGSGNEKGDLFNIIDSFLSPPLHPVGIQSFGAKCDFHTLNVGENIVLSDNVVVRTLGLSHPGGSVGYRIEYDGRALCYCTDVELNQHENDADLLTFISNADLLILDTFFNDDKIMPGWGHSSWRETAQWAKLANVKKLALFHYGFSIFDTDIDAMEQNAKKIFPNTFAAADRMKVEL